MSMATKTVGVRELRDRLSAHLALVKNGETIVVTEHGRPVATIAPYRGDSPLAVLIEEGVVRPPTGPRRRYAPAAVMASGSVSELVAEQRR